MVLYEHYGINKFERNLFQPIKNIGWITPHGGYWASPINSDYKWVDYFHETGFYLPIVPNESGNIIRTIFSVSSIANISYIHNKEDLYNLPLKLIDAKNHLLFVDYEAALKEQHIDAIYFDHGFPHISANYKSIFHSLYNKSIDALLILNPNVIHIVSEEEINIKVLLNKKGIY